MNGPATRKVLILILITCSVVGFSQITDYQEDPVTVAEVWRIAGTEVRIRGTVITARELFTVHAYVSHPPDAQSDRPLAAQIARHAMERGYLENALKYNLVARANQVRADILGVVLIHVPDETVAAFTAVSFAFRAEDLYGSAPAPPAQPIPPPRGFDQKARESLRRRMAEIIEEGRYDRFMELISQNAASVYDLEEVKKNIVSAWLFQRNTTLGETGHLIYVGPTGGRRAFRYYIPAQIVPIADESRTLDEHVSVLLLEGAQGVEVYAIDLHFASSEAADRYFGVERD